MKKLILALFFIAFFPVYSLAVTSNDDEIYVRKDVFDVHMQNINANLERILRKLDNLEKSVSENTAAISALSERIEGVNSSLSARIDSVYSSLSARIDSVYSSLSARIEGVNARVDDLRNGMYLWLVVIGTIVSVVLAWPKVKDFIQSRDSHKKYLTLEDFERLLDARLNSLLNNK